MSEKIRIRIRRAWIAYPGSTVQQNYAEDIEHGYLLWNIRDRRDHDVVFRKLPNPRPFITMEWAGSVDDTLIQNNALIDGARYRIKSHEHVSQSDMEKLTLELTSRYHALEVVYKSEQQINNNILAAGDVRIGKDDLRNSDVLLKLIKNHYSDAKINESEWTDINELVKTLLKSCSDEDVTRNVEWSLRHLKYDNLFAFGEGNEINFDSLPGITGIFGPNRIGKSSIVGTIMYALFNATDRGSISNLHVVNTRKPYGFSRIVINVGGTDYVVERQTIKHENKRGEINAATQLNLFRVEPSGDVTDLNGEQRTDTEQVIRKLIGTSDDFMLTSAATQGDINRFINEGSTQRKKILARYLDLDLFDRMHKLANDEVNDLRVALKEVPERNWLAMFDAENKVIKSFQDKNNDLDGLLESARHELDDLKAYVTKHSDQTPVTVNQVKLLQSRVEKLRTARDETQVELTKFETQLLEIKNKLLRIDEAMNSVDLSHMRHQLDDHRQLESAVTELKHHHDREQTLLKQQERSLRLLDEVPCGDQYPSCKFIKDAHSAKLNVVIQKTNVDDALQKLTSAQKALASRQIDELKERISKCEKLIELGSRLRSEEGLKMVSHAKIETKLNQQLLELKLEEEKLISLNEAFKNDENAEMVVLRRRLDDAYVKIKNIDAERMSLAIELGRHQVTLEKLKSEKVRFDELQKKMKIYDLVANALSKRGVPNLIVSSQLPIINAEIARILHGIVDFTIELEGDVESNAMDVFISDNDSRRMIELASGMEKMISSIAIRVALRGISSLSKTNMFIIDEGFGTLDDVAVEACNRLLVSLKRIFRNVIVITHIDGVKDIADNVIEITKIEKDSRVTHR